MLLPVFPKKHHFGSQKDSGSSGPENLLKIVNCATIKETEKLKEKMVGSKWNWWVDTNIHLDQSPLSWNSNFPLDKAFVKISTSCSSIGMYYNNIICLYT